MVEITRSFDFEAAHFLPNHQGKCRYLHGHSYRLDVIVSGEICRTEGSPRYGMILDFKELDDIVSGIIKHDNDKGLDHNLLNNIFDYPTAEIMVEDIAESIKRALHDFQFNLPEQGIRHITLERVDLWETRNSYASWVRDK